MKNAWSEVTLGEIFDISSSKRVLQVDWKTEGIPFYRAREVVKLAATGYVKNELFISEELYTAYQKKYGVPKAGDLMISAVGTLGACYVVQPNDRFYYKDASVLQFSPKQKVCSKFIQHAFKTRELLDQVHAGSGSTVGTYTIGRANETRLNLPPLAEQKRIAGILDAADALRAKRRAALAQLDSLTQSLFLDLFGDPVSNPMGWEQSELGDLVATDDRINYGVVQPGDEHPGGKPLIRVGDFVGGELDLSGIKFISPEIDAQYERSRLLGTELLVSCVGSIGTVCRVPAEAKGHNIARAVARVPLGSKVEREFMLFCLRSAGVQNYFASETRTVSQPTLNIGLIKTATVTVPPLSLQRRFAAMVESIERQKTRHRAHLAELDALFASLQHRAFRGEL